MTYREADPETVRLQQEFTATILQAKAEHREAHGIRSLTIEGSVDDMYKRLEELGIPLDAIDEVEGDTVHVKPGPWFDEATLSPK